MPRKATPLTDSAIKVAKPKDSLYKLTDGQGLYLEVTPNGSKLWRLKYRFDGRKSGWPWALTLPCLYSKPASAAQTHASCWPKGQTPAQRKKPPNKRSGPMA